MGGSFDPPHMAHLLVAESVREALALDVVLFLPAAQQPLKAGRTATAVEHRVAMTRLATEGNPHFAVSLVDADRPGPSYTVQTLRILREEWGRDCPIWFIVGADSLATFLSWRDPAGILGMARLAVVGRPGVSLDVDALEANLPGLKERLDRVETPLIDISATGIRRRVAQGLSIRYRVPETVREYIEANGLYK